MPRLKPNSTSASTRNLKQVYLDIQNNILNPAVKTYERINNSDIKTKQQDIRKYKEDVEGKFRLLQSYKQKIKNIAEKQLDDLKKIAHKNNIQIEHEKTLERIIELKVLNDREIRSKFEGLRTNDTVMQNAKDAKIDVLTNPAVGEDGKNTNFKNVATATVALSSIVAITYFLSSFFGSRSLQNQHKEDRSYKEKQEAKQAYLQNEERKEYLQKRAHLLEDKNEGYEKKVDELDEKNPKFVESQNPEDIDDKTLDSDYQLEHTYTRLNESIESKRQLDQNRIDTKDEYLGHKSGIDKNKLEALKAERDQASLAFEQKKIEEVESQKKIDYLSKREELIENNEEKIDKLDQENSELGYNDLGGNYNLEKTKTELQSEEALEAHAQSQKKIDYLSKREELIENNQKKIDKLDQENSGLGYDDLGGNYNLEKTKTELQDEKDNHVTLEEELSEAKLSKNNAEQNYKEAGSSNVNDGVFDELFSEIFTAVTAISIVVIIARLYYIKKNFDTEKPIEKTLEEVSYVKSLLEEMIGDSLSSEVDRLTDIVESLAHSINSDPPRVSEELSGDLGVVGLQRNSSQSR